MAETPGSDLDIERAPLSGTVFNRLEDRARHGEDAGIAARDQGDTPALGGAGQGGLGTGHFLPVVGGMAGEARMVRHAGDIGVVADRGRNSGRARGRPPAS